MRISDGEVLSLLASVLIRDVGELDMDASMANVEEWDSLRQLSMILEIEDRFNVEIPDEEVEYLTSARRIQEWLSE